MANYKYKAFNSKGQLLCKASTKKEAIEDAKPEGGFVVNTSYDDNNKDGNSLLAYCHPTSETFINKYPAILISNEGDGEVIEFAERESELDGTGIASGFTSWLTPIRNNPHRPLHDPDQFSYDEDVISEPSEYEDSEGYSYYAHGERYPADKWSRRLYAGKKEFTDYLREQGVPNDYEAIREYLIHKKGLSAEAAAQYAEAVLPRHMLPVLLSRNPQNYYENMSTEKLKEERHKAQELAYTWYHAGHQEGHDINERTVAKIDKILARRSAEAHYDSPKGQAELDEIEHYHRRSLRSPYRHWYSKGSLHKREGRRNPQVTTSDFRRGFKEGLKATLTARKFYKGKRKNPAVPANESEEYVAGFVTAVRMFAPELIPGKAASWGAINAILDGLEKEGGGGVAPPTRPTPTPTPTPPEVITSASGLTPTAEKLLALINASPNGYVKYAEARTYLGRDYGGLSNEVMQAAKAELLARNLIHLDGGRGAYHKLWKGGSASTSSTSGHAPVDSTVMQAAKSKILNILPADGSPLKGFKVLELTKLGQNVAKAALAQLRAAGKVGVIKNEGFFIITQPVEVDVEVPVEDVDVVGTIDPEAWKKFKAHAIQLGLDQEEAESKFAEAMLLAASGDVLGLIAKEEGAPPAIIIGSAVEEGMTPEELVELSASIPGIEYAALLTPANKIANPYSRW